ncbi:unnamed protein product [Rotaria magnacalcarata]|uniref:Uncharacterized protein n=1 Tax=Rotaria magnacalcarata TaxID=392030 RepID=A0A8S3IE73_9BILA|nr:unnamed protein product [Rotaria magnacalcarata]
MDRNQSLSDRIFSQQIDAELHDHIHSNSKLKQQHEVLLSILLLEQQLHSTATKEHKRKLVPVLCSVLRDRDRVRYRERH